MVRLSAKMIVLLILALLPLSGPVLAADRVSAVQDYDAGQVYTGQYPANGLFMRRSVKKAYAPHHALSRLDQVHCPEARRALSEHGRWQGNLNAHGACGDPADPAVWVVGNYLNYMTGR